MGATSPDADAASLVQARLEAQKLVFGPILFQAARLLRDRDTVSKLFGVLGPRYAKRNGGYLRILKNGFRKGDNAPMALMSLLDRPELAAGQGEEEKSEKKAAAKAA